MGAAQAKSAGKDGAPNSNNVPKRPQSDELASARTSPWDDRTTGSLRRFMLTATGLPTGRLNGDLSLPSRGYSSPAWLARGIRPRRRQEEPITRYAETM